MYLADYNILIKQLLPPHWRGTYRETILKVFLKPFKIFYQTILAYKKDTLSALNLNAQVKVIEDLINRKYARENYRFIQIVDGTDGCEVWVVVNELFKQNNEQIKTEIKKYLPLGVKLNLINN